MKLPRIDAFVFEALQANSGADFVRQLVDAFAQEAPSLLRALREARSGQGAAFETAVHSLKSNAVAFGASRLAEMARRIEWQGLTTPETELDELSAELDAVVASLQRLAAQ